MPAGVHCPSLKHSLYWTKQDGTKRHSDTIPAERPALMAMIRLHAFITGRVQGVFFRAETRQQALLLGVTGWVRNMPDCRVEVLAEGENSCVRQLLDWCRTGPPHAAVDHVEELPEPYTGQFDSFSITF